MDPSHPQWLAPYANQAILNWTICAFTCVVVSLLTRPPLPQQVTDQLTINWKKLNIFDDLGHRWYHSVTLWWGIFALLVIALVIVFW